MLGNVFCIVSLKQLSDIGGTVLLSFFNVFTSLGI